MADRSIVVSLKAKVDDFKRGMATAKQSVDDLTKTDVKKQTAAFDALGTRAAVAGAAVAVGIGVAVKSFMDFDKQMSAAAAATDTSGASLDALRAAAIKAGKDTQYSATEAAQGVTELGKAGISASDILGGGLTGALSLAAAGQLDVGEAAETAASAMTQFKLQGKDVPHIADLLAAGANNAQGSVRDLGQALAQSGLVASQVGLSIEETTGGLAAFASAGLIGSDAGTSFKTMLQRLVAPTKENAALMDELGIHVFDANGNFVGLANVAGSLQTALGGMTVEQRNATLATLFGADAIRAASVLYEQGQGGIQGWIDKVDKQGAAADTAGKLTNNLAGDVEKFTGSIETAFISVGSGGNDALRAVVQGATGAVDAIGEIPGPITLVGTALSGLALLGPKAFLSFRQYRSDLDAAGISLDKISEKAPKVGRGLEIAAKGAKGLAVAVAATAAASRAFGEDIDHIGTEQLTRDLNNGASAVDVLNGAIARNSGTGTKFASGIQSIGDAIAAAFNPSTAQSIDSTMGSIYAAFGGRNTSDIQVASERFKEIDTTLAGLVGSGNASKAAEIMSAIGGEAARQGVSVEDLAKKFPQYAEALAAVTNQGGPAKDAVSGLADAQAQAAQSAEDAAKANDALLQSLSAYANLVLGARGSLREYEAAVRAGNEALKENGKNLDVSTEKGSKNQAALDGIASSTLNMVTKTFEARDANTELGVAVGQAKDQVDRGRAAFIDIATKMGMSSDAAVALADSLGLTKENVDRLSGTIVAPKVEPDTAAANEKLAATQGKVDNLGASSASPKIGADPQVLDATVESSNRKLAALDGTRPNPSFTANSTVLDAAVAGSSRKLDALDGSYADPDLLANSGPFDTTTNAARIKLGNLDQSQANPVLSAMDRASGTIAAVLAALANANGRTATTTITTNHVDNFITTGSARKQDATGLAGGGQVRGPGSTTSDSIPALLSDKEYVIKAASVAKYGVAMMDAINTGRYAGGGYVQRLATGGQATSAYVGPAAPTATPAVLAPAIYVQNPWTGEYHEARMAGVAAGVVGRSARAQTSQRRAGTR